MSEIMPVLGQPGLRVGGFQPLGTRQISGGNGGLQTSREVKRFFNKLGTVGVSLRATTSSQPPYLSEARLHSPMATRL